MLIRQRYLVHSCSRISTHRKSVFNRGFKMSTPLSREPRRFAPLGDGGSSEGAPKLKGIVFDVDGTLWLVSLGLLCCCLLLEFQSLAVVEDIMILFSKTLYLNCFVLDAGFMGYFSMFHERNTLGNWTALPLWRSNGRRGLEPT